jgi:iduronate 2-sulfatase
MQARGQHSKALVELVDIYPTLCELTNLAVPEHLAGESFASLLDDPKEEGKEYAVSQFPNPALREWAANPLSPGMRQTFFGPLIEAVEERIKRQQGKLWDRELFENHLMGYSLRTNRHRLVAWLDYRNVHAEPLFLELYDHAKDPKESQNIAKKFPDKTQALLTRLRKTGIGKRTTP